MLFSIQMQCNTNINPMKVTTQTDASRRQLWAGLLVLFVLVAISRSLYWETSFWEWDEVLFARALHNFNLFVHSPHPPGYPVYVAITRVAKFFLQSDVRALVFTNVFFGSLLVIPTYFLYCLFLRPQAAWWATGFSLANPIIWIYSETGFSDMTALFWIITSLALLFRYESHRLFYLGMISFGIAVGIRPQHALFGAIFVPVLLGIKVWRAEAGAAWKGLLLLAATIAAWLVPLVVLAGGLSPYIELLRAHAADTHDPGYLVLRHQMSAAVFVKTKFALMWGSDVLGAALMGLSVLGVVLFAVHAPIRALMLLLVTFLPWALLDFLWLHLYYPRYTMPSIILLNLFAVFGVFELWPRRPWWEKTAAPVIVFVLALTALNWALPVVDHLHKFKSSPVQMVEFVRRNLDPKQDALLCAPGGERLLSYHLPEFLIVPRIEVNESKMAKLQGMNWYYIGLPEPGMKSEVEYHLANESLRRIAGPLVDIALIKMEVLYGQELRWKDVDGKTAFEMQRPEAHCYIKDRGRPRVISFEIIPSPVCPPSAKVSFELNGELLDSGPIGKGRLKKVFTLAPKADASNTYHTLTLRTSWTKPGTGLTITALRCHDLDPIAQAPAQRQ
ncbi:MAG: hypothetical protein HYR55_09055 [Acidobacteria bacterium]|nr:hypothetical protein [Acidobacteriota bacterium]MBI3655161.1 hypothetical protein [Acidobacteriota bacterium]